MTGRERVLALLARQRVDHLPLMPITMMFAADILGTGYGLYARDHRVMVDAQMKTAGMFGFDHVSTIGPPAPEAADLGAKFHWYENQPPSMIESESLLAEKSILARLQVQGPVSGERIENRIRGLELLRSQVGEELVVEGWVEGPCAESADLRGINRLMMDFSDDPVFVHELFEFTVEIATRFAASQIEAGADIIGIGDAAASLVGPRIYYEFVWPWEKRLVDSIHAKGGRVRLHICGNTRRILEGMGKLGCEMVDIDYPVPIEQARQQMWPEQILAGNMDPVRGMRDGTPDTIMQALDELQPRAGSRWIVAAGCEIVRDTPHDNLHAMVKFARTHSAASVAA